MPRTVIVPVQAPMPDRPRIARPKAKVRFNPNAPHLAKVPYREPRDQALRSLHRVRTAVARPLALDEFSGAVGAAVGDEVVDCTPLDASVGTSSACDPDLSDDPIVIPARAARDPAHLDTPYTNAAHEPPSRVTLSPPPSPIAWDGD